MPRESKLEEKIRNSQFLCQMDVFQDFLCYAKQVRDQMQVYEYMQEHEIGINIWNYWYSRFETMRTRCQFINLVKLINKLKKTNQAIQPSQIADYQMALINKMQKMYFKQVKGKRSARQFNSRVHNLHPSVRKIGNIQIYVDESARHNYAAEDLSEWIERNMQDECETSRNVYQQQQKRKPLSFIAKKQERLMELTKQLLKRNSRKSEGGRFSLGQNRLSIKSNIPQKQFEAGNYNTPKNSHQNHSNCNDQKSGIVNKQMKRRTKRTDSGRDSVEILRSMKSKKQNSLKSPKFKSAKQTNSFEKLADDPELKQQIFLETHKCRSVMVKEGHMFSFGKSKSQRKSDVYLKKDENAKDNAFLCHSLSQQTKFLEKGNIYIQKQDFMLQLMIKQIQRQAYEITQIQTFSQIGSNEQNERFNYDKINKKRNDRLQKNGFEAVYETESQEMRNRDNVQLQKLIDFDEDKPSQLSEQFFGQYQNSENKDNNYKVYTFMSQKKKRLTQINQESHFQTQSKGKNHHYK